MTVHVRGVGSFFTNVQVRVPDATPPEAAAQRIREHVVATLAADGFRVAGSGDPLDREIVILVGPRWLSFYDKRSEDQDDSIETWARELSRALATATVSVLVHDSDVLDLGLFVGGKRRDRFDSNPEFSGRRPARIGPAARAKKWTEVLAPTHDERELEAVFASEALFAEHALERLAPALDVELARLGTGYNYLVADREIPRDALRIPLTYDARPPWEHRLQGPPRLASIWEEHGEAPESPPQQALESQPLQLYARLANRGGPGRGLRIEITGANDRIRLAHIELVIWRGKDLERHTRELVAFADGVCAELIDVALPPGAPADVDLADAPTDAMIRTRHAGQLHLNVHGEALASGDAHLRVRVVPLDAPHGAHVEEIDVDVRSLRGAPLRASGHLHAHMLEPLTGDDHTYVLLLVDAPRDGLAPRTLELLAAVSAAWPKGRWSVYASDDPLTRGQHATARGSLGDPKVKRLLEARIGTTRDRVTGVMTTAADTSHESHECSGFELSVAHELGVIALWLAQDHVDHGTAERLLVPVVDELARDGTLVQALLVRWSIQSGGIDTPYDAAVGVQGPENTDRAWASRWLRAVGPGQLWLGPALRARATGLALADAHEVGPALRIAVTDVAATEAALASLLPSGEDFHTYARARRE